MRLLAIIFILVIFAILLVIISIGQIRSAGIKIKDFWGFIEANQNLDSLYKFAKRYDKMSPQEQIIYLQEAEKLFDAFDKIPETVWEEDHNKYSEILETYKDIKVMRWNESQEYALTKTKATIKPKEMKYQNE